jgi:Restriction endonuclease
MNYRLENLSEDDFEKLINMICQKILGMGTVSFAKGRDGGRDGRFEGKANEYPSKTATWEGKFIIQAKHTTDYNASCSDRAFFENQSSIIHKEIEKIKILVQNKEAEHYLLFTNRKETAERESIVKYIKSKTTLKYVDIIGNQTIESWIDQYSEIAQYFKIGRYDLPLTLTDFEIRDIILAFSEQIPNIRKIRDISEDIINIAKERKNELNYLSQDYYDNQIRKKSQAYFADIDDFLAQFVNESFANMYYNFAVELSNKIDIKRSAFDKFESIFEYLYDLIFEQNKMDLKKDKRLIWIFLHHLYFNCHIGRTS